jgi:putative lipoprotein
MIANNQKTTLQLLLLIAFSILAITACAREFRQQDEQTMQNQPSLAGTAWWVEDIAGTGVIDSSHTTIQFAEDGKVAGSTGCNRYFGSAEIDGSSISFGPLAGTRKMCPASLMDQEMKFFKAMGNVKSWEIAETDLLHLRDADGDGLLRASRTDNP